jgi:hypothetical protein
MALQRYTNFIEMVVMLQPFSLFFQIADGRHIGKIGIHTAKWYDTKKGQTPSPESDLFRLLLTA